MQVWDQHTLCTRRPDTAASLASGAEESQQHLRPRALLCCGWGHLAKPRKSGYKQLIKRLKSRLKLTTLEDGEQSLGASPMEDYSLLVIACPRRPLTASDIACAHHFVATGGSLLVLAEAGGDPASGSNLDELLAPFSISVEPSTVLQAVPGEASLHPRHACIGVDGILSKSLAAALHAPTLPFDHPHSRDLSSRPSTALAAKRSSTAATLPPGSPSARPGTALRAGNMTARSDAGSGAKSGSAGRPGDGVSVVYVRGATLVIEAPAVPILASGHTCSPSQLPIGVVWRGEEGQGNVAVLGSSAVFDDSNLASHGNAALLDWLLDWLQQDSPGEGSDSIAAMAAMTNLGGMNLSPDTFVLSERLRQCFIGEPDLAADWTTLLDRTLFCPA
ncbi:Intraflagellar transport protein 52 homolog [Coccomyxa sp. Obi]|nr:Intraflagellar transport protein 52 homolog [Coccomyxa sp. Obi]